MDEKQQELEQPKEEYQTPDLVKHGTVEDLTQSGSNPAAADASPDRISETELFVTSK
jgi:hypothetical protein